MKRTCTFVDANGTACPKPYKARGYCAMHYKRWQTYGDPNVLVRQPATGHGTLSCYANRKCRCELCCAANSDYQIRMRYGVSADERDHILARQGHRCANPGCGASEPGGRGTWKIDHDHSCCSGWRTCGKCVRGLLCHRCNLALGMLGDNATVIDGLAAYLRGDVQC